MTAADEYQRVIETKVSPGLLRYHFGVATADLAQALAADPGVRAAVEREAEARVANAFVQWAAKNEIAGPPLDWAWFGEITRRYSPLHEESGHPAGKSEGQAVTPVWTAPTKLPLDTAIPTTSEEPSDG